MSTAAGHPHGSSRLWGVVVVLLLAGGTAMAWWGTRTAVPTASPPPAPAPATESGPVRRIDLPHDEPELPPGANRGRVQVSCTLCHSLRLVLTQPRLNGKQWAAVVHKMVAVYGAPLSEEQEKEIVAYCETLPGVQPPR
jgi:hypothetical protein